ncbi:MAG TPA: DUF4292 domain-containing protein [Bacteroidia bacterium]
MRTVLRVSLLFMVLVIISTTQPSCRTKKQIVTVKNDTDTSYSNCKTGYKSAKVLTSLLKKNEFDYRWISCKFDASATFDGKTHDFSVSMRGRKDSVIWMSITDGLVGAIEGARILLTCDSVKFMDRLNKQYFTGGYDTLRKMLNIDDLDFQMVQALLIGNSVEFYEEEEKLRPGLDRKECKYLLGTTRKRKIMRVLKDGRPLREPAQSIWMEPEHFKILRIFFTDYNTNRTFDANYETFEPVDSLLFPHKMSFEIRAERNLLIKAHYNKVSINKELTFPFNIPSGYQRIKVQSEQGPH